MTDHSSIVERVRATGVPALSEHLGITKQAIYQWRRIPPERAVDIAKITGIPVQELRPDVFRSESCSKTP